MHARLYINILTWAIIHVKYNWTSDHLNRPLPTCQTTLDLANPLNILNPNGCSTQCSLRNYKPSDATYLEKTTVQEYLVACLSKNQFRLFCCRVGLSIDHGRADLQALCHAPNIRRHQLKNQKKNESVPNLLGGLLYHVTNLIIRSPVVYGLLHLFAGPFCGLDR